MRSLKYLLVSLMICEIALGHSGGLDRFGGHMDHSNGTYHYHSGGGGGYVPGGGPVYEPYSPSYEPRRTAISEEHRAARVTYRTKVRENDARRRLAAARREADLRAAMEPEEAREQRAQAKLKLAKDLLGRGFTTMAVKWLKEILAEFPDTKAAAEAKDLLIEKGVNLTVWYWRARGIYPLLAVRQLLLRSW